MSRWSRTRPDTSATKRPAGDLKAQIARELYTVPERPGVLSIVGRWHMEERRRGSRFIQGAFWIGVYLLLTLTPLFLLLIGSAPPGRSFWTEFSIAIGFAGMIIVGVIQVLPGHAKLDTRRS